MEGSVYGIPIKWDLLVDRDMDSELLLGIVGELQKPAKLCFWLLLMLVMWINIVNQGKPLPEYSWWFL